MIYFSKSPEARARQDSVWVHGVEYKIRTEFWRWINYENMRKQEGISLQWFNMFYKGRAPDDKMAGVTELDKFMLDEQPLPHAEHCEKSDITTWDWVADSEYINAKFLEVYGIDLEAENEMHWHRFLGLFRAILMDITGIMSARQHRSEDERSDGDTYDKSMERQRSAWWIAGTKPAKRARKRKR